MYSRSPTMPYSYAGSSPGVGRLSFVKEDRTLVIPADIDVSSSDITAESILLQLRTVFFDGLEKAEKLSTRKKIDLDVEAIREKLDKCFDDALAEVKAGAGG